VDSAQLPNWRRVALRGEFKNHRKSRSRRGNEAVVFFGPKSASLRRRLQFINSSGLHSMALARALTARARREGRAPCDGADARKARQWILGGGQARGASARAPEHIPQWICEERATTPPPKRHAALRVALKLAWGFVGQSVEYRWGYTPSLAPRPRPI
jgi:hypothetical protein